MPARTPAAVLAYAPKPAAAVAGVEAILTGEKSGREALVSLRSRLETQIEDIRQRNERVAGIIARAMEKQAELSRAC